MKPLYGGDDGPCPTRGLTRAPEQPVALVGVVRRASMSAKPSPTFDDMRDGLPGLPPRASDVRAAVRVGHQGDPVPLASSERHWRQQRRQQRRYLATAASQMSLDARLALLEVGTDVDSGLPGPPPRASAVARAIRPLEE